MATGVVPFATASDGAGSVRIPAAWCGVVGVKPSAGLAPTASGLAEHAVIAVDIPTAAAYLSTVTAGRMSAQVLPARTRTRVVFSPTLGLPLGATPFDQARCDLVRAWLADACRRAGLDLVEAGPDLALHDPGPDWHRRRDAARTRSTWTPSPAVARDQAVLDELLADDVVLACPTTPGAAHGHEGPGEHVNAALTWTFNLTGHPAISIPAGIGPDNIPLTIQLVTASGTDDRLLAVAHGLHHAAQPSPLDQVAQGRPR